MPIIKSAKKRVRVTSKATARNKVTKGAIRSALKKLQTSLKGGKSDGHAAAQSAYDKAAKKGLIHKNKAARKKRQLAAAAKAAGAKVVSGTKVAKAPAKKATAPKKVAAKKPAVKKATAKKAPAKKK